MATREEIDAAAAAIAKIRAMRRGSGRTRPTLVQLEDAKAAVEAAERVRRVVAARKDRK